MHEVRGVNRVWRTPGQHSRIEKRNNRTMEMRIGERCYGDKSDEYKGICRYRGI
jgi:hypothetical protein